MGEVVVEESCYKATVPGFYGGENSDWPQSSLMYNQCRKIVNCDIGASGDLVGRGGTKQLTPTAPAPGQPILSGFRYYNPNTGTREMLVQAGRFIFKIDDDTGAATQVWIGPTGDRFDGGMDNGARCRWGVPFTNGDCLFANGRLYSYDGTTAVKVSATNLPQHITRFTENLDKLFCLSNDYPNHVYRSPQLAVDEAWTATDYSPIKVVKGDKIRDLATMSQWVMVLKERSCHRLDGSTKYDISKSTLSYETGILGDTLASYKGTAIWLSQEGVIYFNEASEKPFLNISANKVNKAIFLYPLGMLDNGAVGYFYPAKRRYLLSLPFMSPPTVFSFDFNVVDPSNSGLTFPVTRYEFPFAVTAIWSADGADDNGGLYFGASDGLVYRADYGFTDDGVAIAGSVETAFSPLIDSDSNELPARMKNVRYLVVGAYCQGTLTMELQGDFGDCVWPSDGLGYATSSFAYGDALVWNVGDWNQKNWAKDYAPVQRIRVRKFNAVRVAMKASWATKNQVVLQSPTVLYYARDPRRWA